MRRSIVRHTMPRSVLVRALVASGRSELLASSGPGAARTIRGLGVRSYFDRDRDMI
jgi:hypothetical protein